MKRLIFILNLVLILAWSNFAQDYNLKHDYTTKLKTQFTKTILSKIEKGISNGNISTLSRFLSQQTYLSLLNGVSGYYSSNQAYYVLENFFNEYHVTSFRFDDVNIDKTTTYATGTYYFERKGNRSEAKVYITLKLSGKAWQITQISIN
ncbi:hypothetical protein BMS3Abin03_00838 [bacterium BMS3Abin03]|nr:hypothetical protein BMS3Abin03_00838 [bacterium BMS3Abin03]